MFNTSKHGGLMKSLISHGGAFTLVNSPLVLIRTATKRASGSKTNKNDSAGRRLGPKVHESNYIKPGQIIMRQRGTKIHPGENTGIGKDHTIFALEPGYVRFYYDPFHPLRKYVGVALKKDLTLPTPHFEPRVRRFGYVEITDPEEALKEESRMSRKEFLQQSEIQKLKSKQLKNDEALSSTFTQSLPEFVKDLNEESTGLAVQRLINVYKLIRLDQSIEQANLQTTYNYVYDLQLQLNSSKIDQDSFNSLKAEYLKLSENIDSLVTVDFRTQTLTKYLNPEQRIESRLDTLNKLDQYLDKLITKHDKQTILELLSTPLIFDKHEIPQLTKKYLPSILPETVKETVVEDINPKKVPKDITIVKKFDEATKQVKIIGRTKEAFLNN